MRKIGCFLSGYTEFYRLNWKLEKEVTKRGREIKIRIVVKYSMLTIMDSPVGLREVVPNQTLPEKCKEFVISTGK